MASTRLTTKIKQQIVGKANTLYDRQITKAKDKLRPDFWDDVTQQVYDELYFPYSTLAVPDNWFINVEMIDIQFDQVWQYNLQLNKTYRVLHITHLINSQSLRIKEDQVSEVFKTEYHKYLDKIKAKVTERNEFVKHLQTVLGNCNTVTQFLKVWPQGEHLLDGIDITTPTVRRKKKEIEVSEEALAKLNTGLLKQTMLNS